MKRFLRFVKFLKTHSNSQSQTIFILYFFSPQSVPQNTRSAITFSKSAFNTGFYTYNPPTRGNYSSFFIKKPDYMVNLLIPEQDLHKQITKCEFCDKEFTLQFRLNRHIATHHESSSV